MEGSESLNAEPVVGAKDFASLFGGFCTTLAVGAVYGWGAIAAELENYGYNLDEKLLMGTVVSLSAYFCPYAGPLFNRWGAHASLTFGICATVGGWLLTSVGVSQGQPAWLIGCYLLLIGQGVQPAVLVALENCRLFPTNRRGLCSALVLTGFASTAIIIAQVSHRFFANNLPGFLLCMAASTGILLFLQLVLFVSPSGSEKIETYTSLSDPSLSDPSRTSHLKDILVSTRTHFFAVVISSFGMTLFVFVVNIEDLNAAAGGKVSTCKLVTIFGLCNLTARPLIGWISDFFPLTRAQFLAIGMLLEGLTMLMLGTQNLLLAAVGAGLSDGFMFAIWPPLVREIYGDAKFGLAYTVYMGTLGVSSIFINLIVGEMILAPESTRSLWGKDVFVLPLLCGLCAFAASFAALYLHKLLTDHSDHSG